MLLLDDYAIIGFRFTCQIGTHALVENKLVCTLWLGVERKHETK